MRDLVALAEKREAACKAEISELLASRSTMYEAKPTRSRSPSPTAAEPEPAAEEEHDEDAEETVEAAAAKIEEAERRMDAAQVCNDYALLDPQLQLASQAAVTMPHRFQPTL